MKPMTKQTIITIHQDDSLTVTWDKWGRMHYAVLRRRGKTYKSKAMKQRHAVADAWAKSAKGATRRRFWR